MRMPHVGVSGDDHWNADCILHKLSNSDKIPPKADTKYERMHQALLNTRHLTLVESATPGTGEPHTPARTRNAASRPPVPIGPSYVYG